MILQKLAQAIRRQDWFQVLIEVLIVIVGIFLGLQVQSWYEEQGERERERYYLQKLHDELVEAEPYASFGLERIDHVYELLEEILKPYRENKPFVPFSNIQCNAMIRSMVTVNFIAPITTINELEQSGYSTIIRSDKIRQLLAEYESIKNSADRQVQSMLNVNVPLQTKYPTIIDLRGKGKGLEFASISGNSCYVEQIAKYPSFGNDLVGNANRFGNYTILMKNLYDAMQRLRQALTEELGISQNETKF